MKSKIATSIAKRLEATKMTTSSMKDDVGAGLSSSDGGCGKENTNSKGSPRNEDAVGAPPAQDTENKKPANAVLKNHTATDPQKLSPLSSSSKINVALDAEQAPAAVPLSEDSKLRAVSSLEIAPKKRKFKKTDYLLPVSISPPPVMQVASTKSRAAGRRKGPAARSSGKRNKGGVLAEMPYISQESAVKKAWSLKIVTSEEILNFPEAVDAMVCGAIANNSAALQWTEDGQSFTIDFAQRDEVLTLMQTYLGHANLSAFTRELNMHGWDGNRYRKGEKSTFTNPHFRRDRTRDLSPIQRNHIGRPVSRPVDHPVRRTPKRTKQSLKTVSSADLTHPPRIRIVLPTTSNNSSKECKGKRDSSSSSLPGPVVNTTLLKKQKTTSKRKGNSSTSLPDSVVNTTLLKRQKTASKRKSNKVKESARRVSVYPDLPAFKGPCMTSTLTSASEITQSPSFDDLNAAALSVYNSSSLPTHLSHDLFVGDLDESVFDTELHVGGDDADRHDSMDDTTVASELLFFDQALQNNDLRLQNGSNQSTSNSLRPGISQRPSAEDFAQLLVDESTASLSFSEHQPSLSTATFLQRERHIAQEMDTLEMGTPPCGKIKMTLHGSAEKAFQISPVEPSAGEEEFFFPDEVFCFLANTSDSPMMEISEEKSFSVLQSPIESAAVRLRRESLSMAATASETSSKALATAMPTQALGVSVVQNHQHASHASNCQLLPFYQSPPRLQQRQQQQDACAGTPYQGNRQPTLPLASSWSTVPSFQDTFVSPPGRFTSTPFPECPAVLASVAPDQMSVNPPMPGIYPTAAIAEASRAHSAQK